MRGKPFHHLACAALAAALVVSTGAAFAGGQTQPINLGGTLQRGGAPLPEFHLDFLPSTPPAPALGGSGDLEIALATPDANGFSFLFSPRPQFGFGFDRATGANRAYAGLTWNLFDSSTVFSNIGVAGSYDVGTAPNEPQRRFFGPPLMLHGALQFGYHLGEQQSLSLSLSQEHAPELRGGEANDNLRLRYGLKF
jgi:hypothetical protein